MISPCVRIMAEPSLTHRSACPQIAAAAHKLHSEIVLVHEVILVGDPQFLALVDVIDPNLLQNLLLHEMADARLRHYRN